MRLSRELFTRKLRPPLVIKALLDMKGDTLSAADPLTLGMLERLEGIVKVREQMKFNVKHGRCAAAAQFRRNSRATPAQLLSDARSSPSRSNNLTIATMLLLVFSFLSFSWEFTKILTYQSRFFSRTQVEQIDLRSNLFMYWPSRAYGRVPQRVHGQRIVLAVQHRRRRRVRGLRDAEDDDERAAAAGAQRRPARRPRRRGRPLRRA